MDLCEGTAVQFCFCLFCIGWHSAFPSHVRLKIDRKTIEGFLSYEVFIFEFFRSSFRNVHSD